MFLQINPTSRLIGGSCLVLIVENYTATPTELIALHFLQCNICHYSVLQGLSSFFMKKKKEKRKKKGGVIQNLNAFLFIDFFTVSYYHYEVYAKLKADSYYLESKQANTFKLHKRYF